MILVIERWLLRLLRQVILWMLFVSKKRGRRLLSLSEAYVYLESLLLTDAQGGQGIFLNIPCRFS